MNRTPPADVRRQLRQEVGFGCPVEGCGNPYLYYHHFNPPWNVENHHRPEGMVALCAEHHSKADAGAFTIDQLRKLKIEGHERAAETRGRFDWMRKNVLAIAGSMFAFETLILVQFRDEPVIWLRRDDEGNLLLNVRMLTIEREPRTVIEDNSWISDGNPVDLECPPSGRLLHVRYANEDMVRIEFIDLSSSEDAARRYPGARVSDWGLSYPILATEVHMKVGGTNIEFGPRHTRWGGIQMTNLFMSHCGAGLVIE